MSVPRIWPAHALAGIFVASGLAVLFVGYEGGSRVSVVIGCIVVTIGVLCAISAARLRAGYIEIFEHHVLIHDPGMLSQDEEVRVDWARSSLVRRSDIAGVSRGACGLGLATREWYLVLEFSDPKAMAGRYLNWLWWLQGTTDPYFVSPPLRGRKYTRACFPVTAAAASERLGGLHIRGLS